MLPIFKLPYEADRRLALDRYLGPVRRIAVFRALGLGDLICATPALRRLRHRFPSAVISLIGLPWAKQWVDRMDSLDEFIAFPGHPMLPEIEADRPAWEGFVKHMRDRHFDLVVQMHGSGRITNALVAQWGARHMAAFHEPHVAPREFVLSKPWPDAGTEVQRLMSLMDVFGVADDGALDVEFPLWAEDREAAWRLLNACADAARLNAGYVCLHAGAQLPSRRWPVGRFAEVAQALMAEGHTVVLTGVSSECDLGRAVQKTVHGQAINLIGKTSIWTLGALIQGSRLLICNDTGVSHVAAATGTPSVVISCGADALRWSPTPASLHRVLWADQPCRPCLHRICPDDHACAKAISVDAVLRQARLQMAPSLFA